MKVLKLWRWSLILAILGLAAYIRLYDLDAGVFGHEQTQIGLILWDMTELGKLPLAGMNLGGGGKMGPLYPYLLWPIFLLSKNPQGLIIYSVLSMIAAVWLSYLFVARHFGVEAAMGVSLCFACSRFASCNTVSNTFLMLPYLLLFQLCLFDFIVRRKVNALAGVIIFLAVLSQLHGTAIIPAAIMVAALLVFRRRPTWRPLVVGLAVAAALYAPFLIYNYQHQWKDVVQMLNLAVRNAPHLQANLKRVASDNLRLATDFYLLHLPGRLALLLPCLTALGWGLIVRQCLPGRQPAARGAAYRLLLLYVALFNGLLLGFGFLTDRFYFLLLPLPFMPLGEVCREAFRWFGTALQKLRPSAPQSLRVSGPLPAATLALGLCGWRLFAEMPVAHSPARPHYVTLGDQYEVSESLFKQWRLDEDEVDYNVHFVGFPNIKLHYFARWHNAVSEGALPPALPSGEVVAFVPDWTAVPAALAGWEHARIGRYRMCRYIEPGVIRLIGPNARFTYDEQPDWPLPATDVRGWQDFRLMEANWQEFRHVRAADAIGFKGHSALFYRNSIDVTQPAAAPVLLLDTNLECRAAFLDGERLTAGASRNERVIELPLGSNPAAGKHLLALQLALKAADWEQTPEIDLFLAPSIPGRSTERRAVFQPAIPLSRHFSSQGGQE